MPLKDIDVRIEISKLDDSQRSQFVDTRICSFGLRKKDRSFYTFVNDVFFYLVNVQAFIVFWGGFSLYCFSFKFYTEKGKYKFLNLEEAKNLNFKAKRPQKYCLGVTHIFFPRNDVWWTVILLACETWICITEKLTFT